MKPKVLAIFDQAEFLSIEQPFPTYLKEFSRYRRDFKAVLSFLYAYKDIRMTYDAYRREIERFLHWSWQVAKKSILSLKRTDIEAYIKFCRHPRVTWIGLSKCPRFIEKQGERLPNPKWRPFVSAVSKTEFRKGEKPKISNFEFSNNSVKDLFAILNSFYSYLLQEEYAKVNPIALIRQKSKFIRKSQGPSKIRRLSELQWQYVIKTAEELAAKDPIKHERTIFIMSILYSMYLRISELVANNRWAPKMNDFTKDSDGNWWFTTVGKGNKQRQIAVSDSMLITLKRWRRYLNLTVLPSPADDSPLLTKIKGKGAITNTNSIRKTVQCCFDHTIEKLNKDGFKEEAETLNAATVHWLRHTGISDDVKHRPREHVRDDAGHSSSATTDKYIDIELKERHRSARNKTIVKETGVAVNSLNI